MASTYKPTGLAVLVLNKIDLLLTAPGATEIKHAFKGKKYMCKLPGGQLYYESKLSLDTDGSQFGSKDWTGHKQDKWGQPATSAKDSDGKYLDADLINYFVLPGKFYQPHGIRIGDIAVVIHGIRKAYACFGDVGPAASLGEGSISLHRELGHETVRNRDTAKPILKNSGIDSGVITIVFPGSGNGLGIRNRESASIGERLFQKLQQEAAFYEQMLIVELKEIMRQNPSEFDGMPDRGL